MKWLVLASFLVCLAKFNEGGVLQYSRAKQNVAEKSSTKDEKKESSIQVSQEKESRDLEEAECLPESEWESNCHYCRCSTSGIAECLKQNTCHIDTYLEPIRCKPNTTFLRDCNTCVCLENGLGLCTVDYCRRSSLPKKSDLLAGKECAPGTSWKSQCNDCGCSPEGYSFCTEKGCLGQEAEPVLRCAPDSMWKNECNTCWCTSDGRALCTKIGCISDREYANFNLEEETKQHEVQQTQLKVNDDLKRKELENGKYESILNHNISKRSVCKPNQSFKLDCNFCKCAANGQSFSCTHNECMEEHVDKDVEVFVENEESDHVERHSVCKPRDTFYISCNTCHCNADGTDYSCSNKPCPLPKDVEIFHELKDIKPDEPFQDDLKEKSF